MPPDLCVPAELLDPMAREEKQSHSGEALDAFKRRLRVIYEAGPGGKADEQEEDTNGENGAEDDEGSEASAAGARIPIPAETFLEDLAQKLEVHPISIYWLLRELREKDGVVSKPELVRFVEDYLTVLVLRLLGHRWPREVDAKELPPSWADPDGIIPLTEGTNERTLLGRVRERIASDFGSGRAGAVEREIEEITGKPLAAWLASDFFKRHTLQFRKRPIAWHLTNSGGNAEKRRGRGTSRSTPAFSCLVYYHRLDADLLPKLRTQYVGPLRTSLQTEVGSLEKIKERSADQDARRLELEEKLEEIKAFDARLDQVIIEGFASSAVDKVAANEPMDKWTSRDGRARPTPTREPLLAQERRYDLDLNDGVRVNIAPLQRVVLAADVLAAKDVEKAVADRAEWRADDDAVRRASCPTRMVAGERRGQMIQTIRTRDTDPGTSPGHLAGSTLSSVQRFGQVEPASRVGVCRDPRVVSCLDILAQGGIAPLSGMGRRRSWPGRSRPIRSTPRATRSRRR